MNKDFKHSADLFITKDGPKVMPLYSRRLLDMDKNILAVFVGSLAAMIICSIVIHHAVSTRDTQCTIEVTNGKVTTVRIGNYD